MGKRFLFLGMYSIDQPVRAGEVRVSNIKKALEKKRDLISITGSRKERRKQVIQMFLQGKFKDVKYAYVESSSSFATEVELLLFLYLKMKGAKILTYIRDAYQLFPEIYGKLTFRKGFAKLLWYLSIGTYKRCSYKLAFPSEGLADYFESPLKKLILEPAAPTLKLDVQVTPELEEAQRILRRGKNIVYIGSVSGAEYGVTDLITAFKELQSSFDEEINLMIFSRPAERAYLKSYLGPNIHYFSFNQKEIYWLAKDFTVFVMPRKRSPYMDLAVPVKLLDYISLRLPIITTGCRECARIVQDTGIGVVINDTVEGLKDGIQQILKMEEEQIQQIHSNAEHAIRDYFNWDVRAETIIHELES